MTEKHTIADAIRDAHINRGYEPGGTAVTRTVLGDLVQRWHDANEDGRVGTYAYIDVQSELIDALLVFSQEALRGAPPQDRLDALLVRQEFEKAELQSRQAVERISTGLFMQDGAVQTPAEGLTGPMIILGNVQA